MTLQEKDSADTQKAVCENMPLPFPATVLCKKDPTRKKPTWLRRGFAYYEQTQWLRITRYMSGVDKKALSLIGGKHKRYNHQKANTVVPRLYLLRANHRCLTDYEQTGWLRITR